MRVLVLSNLLCMMLLTLLAGDIASVTARLSKHRFLADDPDSGDFFDPEAGDDDDYGEVSRLRHHGRKCSHLTVRSRSTDFSNIWQCLQLSPCL
ncbi:unnamed protein product [Taenia asiatica]|uniref:RxLR effector protein n=1 Tax=Taenia asiatica TaxID=60517 RepID=A0A0R3W2J7_TAEAS|nr:unnamed protein product [Taenia asiatica]